jgi:hypothetical protein
LISSTPEADVTLELNPELGVAMTMPRGPMVPATRQATSPASSTNRKRMLGKVVMFLSSIAGGDRRYAQQDSTGRRCPQAGRKRMTEMRRPAV